MPTSPRAAAESLSPRTAAVWSALDTVLGSGTLRVLDVGGGSGTLAVPLAQGGHDVTVVDPSADALATLREIAAAVRPGGTVSIAAANRAGAVLTRALGGHPKEALALLEDRDPAPGRARPVRRRFDPAELLALVEGAGLHAAGWRGVSVVADLLEADSGADPAAVRDLEVALSDTSPYRDVATGLHVLATRR